MAVRATGIAPVRADLHQRAYRRRAQGLAQVDDQRAGETGGNRLGLPSTTQRHWQSTPGGSLLKNVENFTFQRCSGGRIANDSANSGKRSVPGRNTMIAARLPNAVSASAPPQPASPVACLPRAANRGLYVAGRRLAARGHDFRHAVPGRLHEARRGQQPGRAAGRQFAQVEDHVMRELVRPLRVVEAGVADPRQDVALLPGNIEDQMGTEHGVQPCVGILRREDVAVAAQGFQPLLQTERHALRADDGAEALTAGLQSPLCRSVDQFLAHDDAFALECCGLPQLSNRSALQIERPVSRIEKRRQAVALQRVIAVPSGLH